MRQQPAAVDVADQDDGQIRSAGQSHVGQIGCPQVDLGRRTGTLADDGIEFTSERGEFVGNDGDEPLPVGEVIVGADGVGHPTLDHQL